VLAIVLLAIAGVGIAAAMLVRNIARQNANVERRGVIVNANRNTNTNSNSNSSNWNDNSDDNSNVDVTTPPPTDSEQVLADLKRLEDEWTVANINADKKKLNRILADDYVGINQGRPQGKAQYLKTIEPEPSIQHWEFENLKLSLSGDRASLSGVLRLEVEDENGDPQQITYRFTDKFVWRAGRWQAVASEVDQVPVKPGTSV
jgi:ketosteroid isomerase-like protein